MSSITILNTLCPFQLCYNMLTMTPIAQPYSQDACGIGYGAFSALGWAESRFWNGFFGRLFLHHHHLRHHHLPQCAAASLVKSTPVSSLLSPTAAGCHFPLVVVVVVVTTIMIVIVASLPIVINVWSMLWEEDVHPKGSRPKNLLRAVHFLKVYPCRPQDVWWLGHPAALPTQRHTANGSGRSSTPSRNASMKW